MSNHYTRRLSLAGLDISKMSLEDLRLLVKKIMDNGIYGICFSPYIEGQKPGMPIGEKQIKERLDIISPYIKAVRSFSCTEGHELIPKVAKEAGLTTMVGVWLDSDEEHNELEMQNAIKLANDGYVDILAVGNEVLLRGDLSEDQLLEKIEQAKSATKGIPVGYVDAYFEFEVHPRITQACDVILANCYPFWEGCPADTALLYMKEMYRRASSVAGGKKVIVSETGWPNIGTPEEGAVPSYENAVKYFVDTQQWAEADNVEVYYFSSFDEAWKVDAEGDVGAYWGLWDKNGVPKYW
jgi:exo-beta-1,3-glucanase (GH17 family)